MVREWVIGRLAAASRQLLAAGVALMAVGIGTLADAAVDERSLKLTPPRLGLIEGDVSFWRPGAGDEWEAAQINIPLAPGDALAARDGQFELQIGARSFARGGDGTQLRLKSLEPDFVQFEVTQGSLVLDLRQQNGTHVVGVDTPNARFSTTQDGYYRIDVGEGSTRVTVRRAGAATLTPTGGHAVTLGTGEAVMITGTSAGQFEVIAAPAFDEWDRWNYERTEAVIAAPRSYNVANEVYGVQQLEQYGSWRYVNTYGRVWVPYSVPAGWAPYTSGRWLYDPIYGYSWVDYAPWGWAPYHYGRWVYNGYWAWAPGPVVVAPVYSPALVAFYGPSISVNIGFGVPYLGWVALGWGEPLVPWWGSVGFVGTPCWWGWGGPRVVNNINIYNGDVITANQINFYRNASAPGGLVHVPKDKFGGFPVSQARLDAAHGGELKPWRGGKLPVDGARTRGAADAGRPGKGALPELTRRSQQAQAIPAEFSRRPTAAERSAASGGAPQLARSKGLTASAFQRLNERGAAASEPPASAFQRGGSGGSASAGFERNGTGKGGASADAFQRLNQRGAAANDQPPSAFQRGSSSGSATTGFERNRAGKGDASAGAAAGKPGATASSFQRLNQRGGTSTATAPPPLPRAASKSASASSAFRRLGDRNPPAATSSTARRGSDVSRGGSAFQRNAGSPRSPQAKASLPPYERLQGSSSRAASAPADMRRSPRRYASAESSSFQRPGSASKAEVPRSAPSRSLGAAAPAQPSSPAPSGAQVAAPRSVARTFERAPTAEMRSVPKASMPSMSGGSGRMPSAGGMPSGGMRNFSSGGGGGGAARSSGGGGGGGMRNFSR